MTLRRVLCLAILATATSPCWADAVAPPQRELVPRTPLPKIAQLAVPELADIDRARGFKERLVFKLADDLRAELNEEGRFAGAMLAETNDVNAAAEQFGVTILPVFTSSKQAMLKLMDRAANQSGRAQPWLPGIAYAEGDLAGLMAFGTWLLQNPNCEWCEFEKPLRLADEWGDLDEGGGVAGPGGACCRPDGTCAIQTVETCPPVDAEDPDAYFYHGDGTDCLSIPAGFCDILPCCLPDQSCIELREDQCVAQGGQWDPSPGILICEDPNEPIDCASECGNDLENSCFEPGPQPGLGGEPDDTPPEPGACDNLDCCELVCDLSPFCCDTWWSIECVSLAHLICEIEVEPGVGADRCKSGYNGDCFEAHGSGGCLSSTNCDTDPNCCCYLVCDVDDFCCAVQWDPFCVSIANSICNTGDPDVPTTDLTDSQGYLREVSYEDQLGGVPANISFPAGSFLGYGGEGFDLFHSRDSDPNDIGHDGWLVDHPDDTTLFSYEGLYGLGRKLLNVYGIDSFGEGSLTRGKTIKVAVIEWAYWGAEPYTDANGNGAFDGGEPFIDANGNGVYDLGETYTDVNSNGVYDGTGSYTGGEPFTDNNANGIWDVGEPFTDTNGNFVYDAGEAFTDNNISGSREPGHEDLLHVTSEPGQTLIVDPDITGPDHATACLSIIGASVEANAANGYTERGLSGIAPDADMYFFPLTSVEDGPRYAEAFLSAYEVLGPGDVTSNSWGPPGSLVTGGLTWTMLRIGADLGITNVIAAGNDCEGNLDDEDFLGDSGAVIIGAGSPGRPHSRLGFSNHWDSGEIVVNCQAWGSNVTSAGYGGLLKPGGDEYRAYSNTFNGTSAATPQIAGVVACLQGLAKQFYGVPLSPEKIRAAVATGFPQQGVINPDDLPGHDPALGCVPDFDPEEDPNRIGPFPALAGDFSSASSTILNQDGVGFDESPNVNAIYSLTGNSVFGNEFSIKSSDNSYFVNDSSFRQVHQGPERVPAGYGQVARATYLAQGEINDVLIVGRNAQPNANQIDVSVEMSVVGQEALVFIEAYNNDSRSWQFVTLGFFLDVEVSVPGEEVDLILQGSIFNAPAFTAPNREVLIRVWSLGVGGADFLNGPGSSGGVGHIMRIDLVGVDIGLPFGSNPGTFF